MKKKDFTPLMRIFYPLAALYAGLIDIRNYLYDQHYLPVYQPPIPTIIVGNLTVGGTGKTPHVEYLIRLLAKKYYLATLSRGYGRMTKGCIIATSNLSTTIPTVQQTTLPSAMSIGDEPMQFFTKYADQIAAVAVCEKRVTGVQNLLKLYPALQAIVLDDAFQHRSIAASFSIILTDYQRLFYKDFVLPAGLLRERRTGAKRADAIVITKCPPQLPIEQQMEIRHIIQQYTTPDTPIFFSTITYQSWQPLAAANVSVLPKYPKIILLTGIAHTNELVNYIENNGYQILKHLQYKDHYNYQPQDILQLQAIYQQYQTQEDVVILTTEKDMVRLQYAELQPYLTNLPIYYLPIQIKFLSDENAFNHLIINHIESFYAQWASPSYT